MQRAVNKAGHTARFAGWTRYTAFRSPVPAALRGLMSFKVHCNTHGEQPETLVCQHIAVSLESKSAVGFHWPETSNEEFPNSWCSDCNERLRAENWEWTGEAEKQLGAKLLCAMCYLDARKLALGY